MDKYTVEEGCVIRNGASIGERTLIKCGTIIGTGCIVGSDCYIGPGAIMLHMQPNKKSIPSRLGNDVFVGAGAIICPGVIVPDHTIIGAGTVINKPLDKAGIYVGNPFRRIRSDISIGKYSIIEEPFEYGEDNWIGSYVHLRPNMKIGDRTEIRDFCFIGPDVTVGKNTRIYQFCNIAYGTRIGDDCFIGMGVMTQNDKQIAYPNKSKWIFEPAIIGNNVRIGAGARILPGVTLADNCRIGAGAVVTRSTEPGYTYVGVPARKMINGK